MNLTPPTDAQLMRLLLKSLQRMEALHHAMMNEANHRHTAWSAKTIYEMNLAPTEARNLIAIAIERT